MVSLQAILTESAWIAANPHFAERPATYDEFLGPKYLNLDDTIRDRLREELRPIFGDTVNPDNPTAVPRAIFTGAIGIGKTTAASIILTYLVHWCLCLKDPQGFFKLMPGSRIAFMMMSTSEQQAREVLFTDIKARIQNSPWFRLHPTEDTGARKRQNQIRFPKDIWIIPGDSQETTFEGYNILGGVLDEADSHKVTDRKDYAEIGWDTIIKRMESRFGHRGFAIVVGQMKSATGFASRRYSEFKQDPDAVAVRLTIWESFGDDHEDYKCKLRGPHPQNPNLADRKLCGQTHKFTFDVMRRQIIPDAAMQPGDNYLRIPEHYRKHFEINPEKSLKDLAGIPPAVGSPFISLIDKILACRTRWTDYYGPDSPVKRDGKTLEPWALCNDTIKRCGHIDIAYADDGDSLGIAIGHVREVVEIDGEWKPHIVFDLVARFSAPPGGEIFINEVRHWIYSIRDDRRYKVVQVTFDGFQSQDTIQQFNKRRIMADVLSVDRQLLPYHDLREAIYEGRVDFPPLMVRRRVTDLEDTEIIVKELSELVDNGKKIDHPEGGSKDVADCLAAVVCTLMLDSSYRKGRKRTGGSQNGDNPWGDEGTGPLLPSRSGGPTTPSHPAFMGQPGITAPIPPSTQGWR